MQEIETNATRFYVDIIFCEIVIFFFLLFKKFYFLKELFLSQKSNINPFGCFSS